MTNLSKTIPLILILIFVSYCGQKQQSVEKHMEDGVEIIVNHIKPYRIEGEPSIIHLEEELIIDTEKDKLANVGLMTIRNFDVDSENNLYILSRRTEKDFVFKFDCHGELISTFGRKGEGPGEMLKPSSLLVGARDEIAVAGGSLNKLSIFSKEGKLIKEKKFNTYIGHVLGAYSLENNQYLLAMHEYPTKENGFCTQYYLSLCNNELEELKELDRAQVPFPEFHNKFKGIYHTYFGCVSDGKVFTAFQDKGYEIRVYDLQGNLLRKIHKEYTPVPVSEEYKKKYMMAFMRPRDAETRKKITFPDTMPPFHSFFTDEEGRLFVMTYEPGENPGEYIYDIFNKGGIHIARKNINILHDRLGLYAWMKNGRLYCLQEKRSFFKRLVVFKVYWN
ncbi:MAG: 6-bladed beta-propeller [Candidatus Aminicenantes bacterium]|nr:6-bladed beta-propeller [Candidatus Aminicenantes bacterium]